MGNAMQVLEFLNNFMGDSILSVRWLVFYKSVDGERFAQALVRI